jgi:hypothetical protein
MDAISNKLYAQIPMFRDDDPETEALFNERWGVAEELLSCEPKTVVDLAWQAEAYLLADLDLLSFSPGNCSSDWMLRTLFQHVRSAVPQPNDPAGLLSIDVGEIEA